MSASGVLGVFLCSASGSRLTGERSCCTIWQSSNSIKSILPPRLHWFQSSFFPTTDWWSYTFLTIWDGHVCWISKIIQHDPEEGLQMPSLEKAQNWPLQRWFGAMLSTCLCICFPNVGGTDDFFLWRLWDSFKIFSPEQMCANVPCSWRQVPAT